MTNSHQKKIKFRPANPAYQKENLFTQKVPCQANKRGTNVYKGAAHRANEREKRLGMLFFVEFQFRSYHK